MQQTPLGSLVRHLREQAYLSQEELAARAQVSRATIQNIESNRRIPRRAGLRRIATALGVDVAELQAAIPDAGGTEDTADLVIRRRDLEEGLAELQGIGAQGTAAYKILSEEMQRLTAQIHRIETHSRNADETGT